MSFDVVLDDSSTNPPNDTSDDADQTVDSVESSPSLPLPSSPCRSTKKAMVEELHGSHSNSYMGIG